MEAVRVFRKGVRRIGRLLVRYGFVGWLEVREALEEQKRRRRHKRPRKFLGEILVEEGCLSQEDLDRALSRQELALLVTTQKRPDGILLLELQGYVDGHTSEVFDEALASVTGKGAERIILDCERLDYMNSDGIGPLLAHVSKVRQSGGDLKLSNVSGKAATVIEVLGLAEFLGIHDSVEAAASAFSEPMPSGLYEESALRFVASKRGMVFHLPSCRMLQRIRGRNRVYFASRTDAEMARKKPCSLCFGATEKRKR